MSDSSRNFVNYNYFSPLSFDVPPPGSDEFPSAAIHDGDQFVDRPIAAAPANTSAQRGDQAAIVEHASLKSPFGYVFDWATQPVSSNATGNNLYAEETIQNVPYPPLQPGGTCLPWTYADTTSGPAQSNVLQSLPAHQLHGMMDVHSPRMIVGDYTTILPATPGSIGPGPPPLQAYAETFASSPQLATQQHQLQHQSDFMPANLRLQTAFESSHSSPYPTPHPRDHAEGPVSKKAKHADTFDLDAPLQQPWTPHSALDLLPALATNANFQLGQSGLGPGINNWNQALRLPEDRCHRSPTNQSLQTPCSPTASSIASSTRGGGDDGGVGRGATTTTSTTTTTRRTREEMIALPAAYRCTEPACGKGFNSQSDLNHHARYHAGPGRRPKACATCGRDFLHQKDLDRHAVVHSSDPRDRHYCPRPECRGHKGYRRADHLTRHHRLKHAAAPVDSVLQTSSSSAASASASRSYAGDR